MKRVNKHFGRLQDYRKSKYGPKFNNTRKDLEPIKESGLESHSSIELELQIDPGIQNKKPNLSELDDKSALKKTDPKKIIKNAFVKQMVHKNKQKAFRKIEANDFKTSSDDPMRNILNEGSGHRLQNDKLISV